MRTWISAACAIVLGCGAGCGAAERAQGKSAANRDQPEPGEPAGPRLGGRPADGVPHSALLADIALAPDGSAALSSDAAGGVRVWTALDGSAQPQMVPARGAQRMALARRRDGGLTLALIDTAGGLQLFRADRRGRPRAVTLAAPRQRAIVDVRVLPGGERIAILADDHAIELVDDAGRVVSRVEARAFRPAAIEVDGSGRTIVAVGVEPGTQSHELSIHRIAIESGDRLVLRPRPFQMAAPAALGPSRWSLSPSGRRVAVLAVAPAASSWHMVLADLGRGVSETIDLPLPTTEQVVVGFVDETTILASSTQTSGSWRIELARGRAVFPHVSPGNQMGGVMPHAFGRGIRVAGVGTWLHVETVGEDRLYLGYDRFEALSGTISPSRRRVAWVSNGNGVYLRSLGGSAPARVHLPNRDPQTQANRVFFADDRRLVIIDASGGMRLVDVTTGAELDAADLGSRLLDAELDPSRSLLRVMRPGGQVWIFAVAGGRFDGPKIVGDGAIRSGFLDGKGAVLWTLDPTNKMRRYDLAELARGLSRGDVESRGETIEHSPMTIDRQGRFYISMNDGKKVEMQRFDGPRRIDRVVAFGLPPNGVSSISPSPHGSGLALLRADGVLSVFTGGPAAQPTWSRSFVANLYSATWSGDGSLIAVASHLGAAVLDARSGEPVDTTCGPWFEVRRTAPVNPFGVLQQPNACEWDRSRD